MIHDTWYDAGPPDTSYLLWAQQKLQQQILLSLISDCKDELLRSSPKAITTKTSTKPQRYTMASAISPILGPDMQYFAYKIGSISKSKIEREAHKAEPRLHKLVGHCSLFDNARRYILDRISHEEEQAHHIDSTNDLSIEEDDKDEPSFEYVEDLSDKGPTYKQSNSHGGLQGVLVVKATEIAAEDYDDLDWDDNSDSTDADDEDNWSDSTCEEENQDLYFDRKTVEICGTGQPGYRPQDDDLMLWSQQPQVMSQSQANSLLIEAFG
ncbi:hypothetical protein LTR67_009108 [Exophiala xenobiotica]